MYYGLLESSETNRLDVGGAESVTLTNLVAGATYFFYVVAYSPERFESEPSNVIFYRTSALSPAVASANDNGTFRIRCLAAPGITCVIEYSESLCPPDWKFMKSVEADEYGLVSFVDADMESHPGRFYRVGIPNNPEPSLPGQQEGR